MRIIPYYNNRQLKYYCQSDEVDREMVLPEEYEPTELGTEPIDIGYESNVHIYTDSDTIWNCPWDIDSLDDNGRPDIDLTSIARIAVDNLVEEEPDIEVVLGEGVLYKGEKIMVTYDEYVERDLDYYAEVKENGWRGSVAKEIDITEEFTELYAKEVKPGSFIITNYDKDGHIQNRITNSYRGSCLLISTINKEYEVNGDLARTSLLILCRQGEAEEEFWIPRDLRGPTGELTSNDIAKIIDPAIDTILEREDVVTVGDRLYWDAPGIWKIPITLMFIDSVRFDIYDINSIRHGRHQRVLKADKRRYDPIEGQMFLVNTH